MEVKLPLVYLEGDYLYNETVSLESWFPCRIFLCSVWLHFTGCKKLEGQRNEPNKKVLSWHALFRDYLRCGTYLPIKLIIFSLLRKKDFKVKCFLDKGTNQKLIILKSLLIGLEDDSVVKNEQNKLKTCVWCWDSHRRRR